MSNKDSVKVIPLGGLGEIGKNITAFEYGNEIVIIDCGISFPDEEMYGVDLVIPDITYLLNNKDKVKAIFLTHGHEDHIGSLPYILQQLNRPVYGTALTLGIVENKLKEHNMLSDCELNKVEAGDIVELKNLKIEFIRNTHSIADSCSIAIHTPVGVILHTGDFKIDYTPIDGLVMDFHRIAELGKKGVLLLMADSTNVQRKGHTISEKSIGETLTKIFSNAKGRVIVATFASNIHRMQQIIDASIEYGRKVAFSGRSMENISKVAMDLGYLHIPETYLITVDEMKNYPNEQITIITTGSQGEPMAALARIAYSNHRKIAIEPKDLFIISASPIPGNEKLISRVINELFKKGADVIYEALEEVHVSGHAYEEELKLIHTLVHPKYFMPVHGEYRHLKRHVDLAMELGMERENIFSLETGQVLEISHEEAKVSGKVRTGSIFVDGIGVGDVGNIVLRDRRYLAQDGMLTIVVTLEKESYSVIAGPDIITRGFIYVKESEDLINEVKGIVKKELENCLENKIIEWYVLKSNIKKSVEKYLYEKTKRRPIVLPIIMEI
ncbi:ribonuclease J [Clostridium botulinum]|uniref:Ribonuclease J n=1 Tax=Clostridium botulinum (strain Hall / ATCC 3502 / NCTC 13319 / Type A) TaxID=441771 RepID=A5I1D0_CLOBH|nr:ribonuclease J [Clostridium botulinum]ABS35467.1 RNA-metabolising metallo-beta-lactamase [Clostridium botulinum A str. ATCC 19397]ABS36044.1 RNA-metabolising metallo-beta-lactamase [Clostridium botulinum A str. Hall]APQ72114.1 beta-CASP ribonuclease, RNase J family protein [Clostridium botulinum]APQ97013.1 beta-CASP ribonuclease, RNase J family protein [Clostridium botulinum]AWB17206.1 ribonuclease J [Clostridium botulinum]